MGSYAQAARGSVSVAPAAALRAEAAADTARELQALLKLLSNLTQRELVDFSIEEGQPGEHPPPDIAQVGSGHDTACALYVAADDPAVCTGECVFLHDDSHGGAVTCAWSDARLPQC